MDLSTRSVYVPSLATEFEVLADDAFIGPAIEQGSWAADETRLLLAHVEPGTKMVDLGANVGWFAAQALRAGAEVEAFEPVPAIADICQRNLERVAAAHGGRFRLHRCAAGAERGQAQIALDARNHGDNRVLEAHEPPADMTAPETLEIEVRPVDECARGPARFLKIDTQGSEWLALAGAERLLAESPDLALLMELWPYALRGASAEELLARLEREGFTLGKATDAPYPMSPARILGQMSRRDAVHGGIDLYGVRGERPFHVLGVGARLKGWVRALKED